MEHARAKYVVSERRARRVVRQWRGTQRHQPPRRTDEDELTQAILALGVEYGRYGYRRITVLLLVRTGACITKQHEVIAEMTPNSTSSRHVTFAIQANMV